MLRNNRDHQSSQPFKQLTNMGKCLPRLRTLMITCSRFSNSNYNKTYRLNNLHSSKQRSLLNRKSKWRNKKKNKKHLATQLKLSRKNKRKAVLQTRCQLTQPTWSKCKTQTCRWWCKITRCHRWEWVWTLTWWCNSHSTVSNKWCLSKWCKCQWCTACHQCRWTRWLLCNRCRCNNRPRWLPWVRPNNSSSSNRHLPMLSSNPNLHNQLSRCKWPNKPLLRNHLHKWRVVTGQVKSLWPNRRAMSIWMFLRKFLILSWGRKT